MTNIPKLVQNYEVLNNVKFRTDHRLIRIKFILNQPKKSRRNFKPLPKIPKTDEEIKYYTNSLKSRIENNLQGITSVQTYYDELENAITYSLTNGISQSKGKQHKIFSRETIALINKRSELSIKKSKDIDTKKELSKLYKETSKAIKKDYSEHRRGIITENLNKFRSTKRAFKALNLHKTWIQKLEGQHKEANTRQDILHQATIFYQELYKSKEENIEQAEDLNQTNSIQTIIPIDEQEIYLQLKQLKSDKSPGPDGITNEALKLGAPILLRPLTELFNLILETEIVPNQWCKSDIILLYKER